MNAVDERSTVRDFYAVQRGGGLLSETVSQHIGAAVAVVAHRLRLAPSAVTAFGLLIGWAGSAIVILFGPGWVAGTTGLLAWHLAYAFDCADGQLARVTRQTSAAGARLDVLSDFAVQVGVVTAVVITAERSSGIPAWFAAIFAATWLINLFTSVLASGPSAMSLLSSSSPTVRALKLIRDYAAIITVCGLVISVIPNWTPWLMAVLALTNGGFLLLGIAQSLRHSLIFDDGVGS